MPCHAMVQLGHGLKGVGWSRAISASHSLDVLDGIHGYPWILLADSNDLY